MHVQAPHTFSWTGESSKMDGDLKRRILTDWDDSEDEPVADASGDVMPLAAINGAAASDQTKPLAAAQSTEKHWHATARESLKTAGLVIEMTCTDGKRTSVNTEEILSFYGEDSPLYKSVCGTSDLQGSTKFHYESWVLEAFVHMAQRGNLPKGFLKKDPERRSKVFVEAADFFLCEKAKTLLGVLKANHEASKDIGLVKEKQRKELKKKLHGGFRVSAGGVASRDRADTYEMHEKALAKYL
ncbi:unnamed protein product [Polarella glacialis]|uniref:Uncharacterized protein n=1 Tax=Polarella glacialis TaxID=89957 RepID=A0A813L3B6_POLGL|nr:unnamed protein product [Polarella glacialis]